MQALDLAESDTAPYGLSPGSFAPLELRSDWYPRRHPVDAYLAGLDSQGSRRVQGSALEQLVQLIFPQLGTALRTDARLRYRFPWHRLRYQETGQIREQLARAVEAGSYAPATANRMLVESAGGWATCQPRTTGGRLTCGPCGAAASPGAGMSATPRNEL